MIPHWPVSLQVRAHCDVPRTAEVALHSEGRISRHDEFVVMLNHYNIWVDLAVLEHKDA
jgi:hypothetical protein